jgi:hypothetical protein
MPCHRRQRVPVSGNEEPAEAAARMGESRRILRMGCVGKGLAEVRGGSRDLVGDCHTAGL